MFFNVILSRIDRSEHLNKTHYFKYIFYYFVTSSIFMVLKTIGSRGRMAGYFSQTEFNRHEENGRGSEVNTRPCGQCFPPWYCSQFSFRRLNGEWEDAWFSWVKRQTGNMEGNMVRLASVAPTLHGNQSAYDCRVRSDSCASCP